jgi:hypothetical protein
MKYNMNFMSFLLYIVYFLLKKSISKKTIACALNYVEIMSKENWNNMKQLM